MRQRIQCEFSLIRYVPDVLKGEFANIGVILREAASERMAVRFTRDWRRVRCLHEDVDTEMLEAMEGEIAERCAREEGPAVLKTMEESLSNSVQIVAPRGCLAESLPAEMEQLMRMYVESPAETRPRKQTGRTALAGVMRREFERAGVWGAMRKRIAAATYTAAGDPLKIDCGYRPNGVVRMFHAVSVTGDVEGSKGLAYTASRLRQGVQRLEGADLELTAIVEPLRGVDGEEQYRFCVETMEREEIRVMTSNDLPRIAQTARLEMRV